MSAKQTPGAIGTGRIAAKTIILYWLVLLGGLFLYTYVRDDDPRVADPLWFGALMGTTLGQVFAMRNLRLWFVLVLLAGIAIWIGPFTPPNKMGAQFWMAFLPATLCGHASLSDRGSLFAFWFPAVIWMLTILDGTAGVLAFTTTSSALLGALALMFVAFLYVREQRRVGLWRTVAPTPLAAPVAAKLLKESPKLKLGATGWSLVASGAAFALTAWIAPRLWHVEQLTPQLFVVENDVDPNVAINGNGTRIRCRQRIEMEQPRARVKEYFDIGRAHDDEHAIDISEVDLPYCDQILAMPSTGPAGYYDSYGRYHDHTVHGYCYTCGRGYSHDPWANGQYNWGNSYGTGDSYGNGYSYGDSYAQGHSYRDSFGENRGYNRGEAYSRGDGRTYTPPQYDRPRLPEPSPEPQYTPPQYTPPQYTPEPQYTPPTYTPPEPTYTPPVEPPTPPEPTPVAPELTPEPPPQIAVAPEPPPTPEPTPEPTPPPAPEPTPPPVAAAPTPAPTAAPTATTTRTTTSATTHDLPFLQWIMIALAGAVAFQMLLLGMRPVRRALTLRHIRKPFWNETIDQRISNWWHLVLVGLRDAGWRTDAGEAPRELAKRANIDGVEQAATILDRARHGVGLDASDLADMREAAETAYRTSRTTASPFARVVGWFRRPLA